MILFLVGIHLLYLHETGSSNPLGTTSGKDIVKFHTYFTLKDLVGAIFILFFIFHVRIYYPWILGDPDNFIPANAIVTPVHIQPEWYFLFAYAILRRIPNKLGGVIALLLSVLVYFTLPLIIARKYKRIRFRPLHKFYFWSLIIIFILLTWIGARPVEDPYIFIGQILSLIYFF